MRVFSFFLIVILTLWRFGWHSSADVEYQLMQPQVIYGEDNRQDFFEIENPQWLKLAQSTVALFDHRDFYWDDKQNVFHVEAKSFGPSFGLCEDEPFYHQPSKAFCSGFLVEPDIVVTAGHCMRNKTNCENVLFAFGYNYSKTNSDPLKIPREQVYFCSRIIHSQKMSSLGIDFAVVELDRQVREYSPLVVRRQGQLTSSSRFTVVGYPSGLPGKLAHGGSIRSNGEEAYFVTNLDAFVGNSGSAVFNSDTGIVEGILARGAGDFVYDQQLGCRRSLRCAPDQCRGEEVVRIKQVLPYIYGDDLLLQNQ